MRDEKQQAVLGEGGRRVWGADPGLVWGEWQQGGAGRGRGRPSQLSVSRIRWK